MITGAYISALDNEDPNKRIFNTEGCGCCSQEIDIKDRERIIEELKQNLYVVLEECPHLELSFAELCNEVINNPKTPTK